MKRQPASSIVQNKHPINLTQNYQKKGVSSRKIDYKMRPQ